MKQICIFNNFLNFHHFFCDLLQRCYDFIVERSMKDEKENENNNKY